jgi:hypothetical protein
VAVRGDGGIEGGFDPDHAYLLRSMGLAPRIAAQLRTTGLSDTALVALIEDALFRHGLSWDDVVEAFPWLVAGFEPDAAKAWRAAGFSPAGAQAWRREHFGVKQAVQWRRLGDTPARAREVSKRFSDAGVTVIEGLGGLDRGLTVDEICAPKRTRA